MRSALLSSRDPPDRLARGRPSGAIARAAAASLGVAASGLLMGCGPGVVWYGKSPDRAQRVDVLQDGDGQLVRVGGRSGPRFLGIGVEAIAWSPDGRRLAYPARTPQGWLVVRAEGSKVVTGPVYDGIGAIVWSADGEHLAIAAERKGRWLVSVDGREGPTFESLRARSLVLSPDGKHCAYAADEAGGVVVVSGGVKSARYAGVGRLVLSASGQAAFVGRKAKGAVVVSGGEESPLYEDVADLSFSPSGRRVAWIARRFPGDGAPADRAAQGNSRPSAAWRVVSGGVEGEAYDRIGALVWAPRTDALAYPVGRGTEEWVVLDAGTRPERSPAGGAAFEGVLPGSLTFGAEGTVLAYAGRRAGRFRVVVGGEESPPYDEVEAPLLVGDSAAAAYVARRGEASFLVVDGHQGPVLDGATGLALSPDGRRFLLAARAGVQVEVLEGEVRGGPCGGGRCSPHVTRRARHDVFVGGTLVWSASGAHSGYLAGDASSRGLFLVIDGARAGAFDMAELMAGLARDPELGLALQGDSRVLADWVRAEVTLAEAAAGRASAPPRAGAREIRR